MTTRLRVASAVVVTVAALAFAPIRTHAHPLSATTVAITLGRAGALEVLMTMDADAMIARLDVQTETPLDRGMPGTAGEKAARLWSQAFALAQAMTLTVDGRPLPLLVAGVDVDEASDAVVRMTASGPRDPSSLSWQTTLAGGPYALSVHGQAAESVVWVRGANASGPIPVRTSNLSRTLRDGVVLGFTHVVPKGLDHILFVAGLGLLGRRRHLLLLVSAFTVAHSITLGLGLFGVVSLPAGLVEPLIALSVAYIGLENVMRSEVTRWRIGVVFVFGLLHGLGFADVLSTLGTSQAALLATLVSFNVGVEIGQLAVLGATLTVLALVSAARATAVLPAARLASAAVGVTGAVWMVERMLA